MPRDVAGISRVGMFEQVTTPDGTVFTPRSGTGGTTTYEVTGKRATGLPLHTSNARMAPDALTYRGLNEGALSPCESMQNPPFCDDYAMAPVADDDASDVIDLSRPHSLSPKHPRNPLPAPRAASSRSHSAIASLDRAPRAAPRTSNNASRTSNNASRTSKAPRGRGR